MTPARNTMQKKAVVLWTLLALYVPFLATGLYANLFAECSCSHCHWFMLKMWPVLPATLAGEMVCSFDRHQMLSRSMQTFLGAVVTVGFLAVIAWIGLRSKRWFIGALILEFLVACWMALATYALVRA